jgi:hypothetical protein
LCNFCANQSLDGQTIYVTGIVRRGANVHIYRQTFIMTGIDGKCAQQSFSVVLFVHSPFKHGLCAHLSEAGGECGYKFTTTEANAEPIDT